MRVSIKSSLKYLITNDIANKLTTRWIRLRNQLGANITPADLSELPAFIRCFVKCFFVFAWKSSSRKAMLAFMKTHAVVPAMDIIKEYLIRLSEIPKVSAAIKVILMEWEEEEEMHTSD